MKPGDYVRLDRCQGINRIEEYDDYNNKFVLEDIISDDYAEETCQLDEKDVLDYDSNVLSLIKEHDILLVEERKGIHEVYEVQAFRDPIEKYDFLGIYTGHGKARKLHEINILKIITREEFDRIGYTIWCKK